MAPKKTIEPDFDTLYKDAEEATSIEDLRNKMFHPSGNESTNIQPIQNKLAELMKKKDNRDPFLSIAGKLAQNARHQAVRWCLSLGANIDDVLYGYALGGHDDCIEPLLARGGSIEQVILGYVKAKNTDKIDSYRADYIEAIIYAYIITREHEKVRELFNQDPTNTEYILVGYAATGQDQYVEQYLENVKKIMHDRMMTEEEILEQWDKLIKPIVEAYARTGHHTQVEKYRLQEKIPGSQIAEYYQGTEKAKEHDIHLFLRGYLTDRESKKESDGITTKEYYHPFFKSFQKSFSDKKAAVEALQTALFEGKPTEALDKHLAVLRNGELGRQLRRFIKSGKANELFHGDPQVKTIRQFIELISKGELKNAPGEPPAPG